MMSPYRTNVASLFSNELDGLWAGHARFSSFNPCHLRGEGLQINFTSIYIEEFREN